MDLQVTHDGQDITNSVLTYDRDQNLCTGVGNLAFTTHLKSARTFTTWDEVILHEGGNKIGTYYISATTKSVPDGKISIECQDVTKRLTDYFVEENTSHNYDTYTKYWITKYLDEAGVSYSFKSAGNGSIILKDTTFGMSSAFDIIEDLLQKSGWHMYANANGTLVIGKLFVDSEAYTEEFSYRNILTITRATDDKSLRNRAVVIGRTDYTTGQEIVVDISKHTPWNFDIDDKRAVVVASAGIGSYSAAYDLARRMLNTFTSLTDVKTIATPGYIDAVLGDVVFVNTDVYTGTSLVTSIQSSLSNKGLITTLVLDEKCPRLVAPYTPIPGPGDTQTTKVYAGTTISGIWKKPIYGSDWSEFNEGLPNNSGIEDLSISNGNFACVTTSGLLYTRNLVTDTWNPFIFESILDTETQNTVDFEDLEAVCCVVDQSTSNTIVGYNTTLSGVRNAYVMEVSPTNTAVRVDKVYNTSEADQYNCTILDLSSNGIDNIISTFIPASGLVTVIASGAYGWDFGESSIVPSILASWTMVSDVRTETVADDGYSFSLLPAPDEGIDITEFWYDGGEDGDYFYTRNYPSSYISSNIIYDQQGSKNTSITYIYWNNSESAYYITKRVIEHETDPDYLNEPYFSAVYNFEITTDSESHGEKYYLHKIDDTNYSFATLTPGGTSYPPSGYYIGYVSVDMEAETSSTIEYNAILIGGYDDYTSLGIVLSESTCYCITVGFTEVGETGNRAVRYYYSWGIYEHTLDMDNGDFSSTLISSNTYDWGNVPFWSEKSSKFSFQPIEDGYILTRVRYRYQHLGGTSVILHLSYDVVDNGVYFCTDLMDISAEWGEYVLGVSEGSMGVGFYNSGVEIDPPSAVITYQGGFYLQGYHAWFMWINLGTMNFRIVYDTSVGIPTLILDATNMPDGNPITYDSYVNRVPHLSILTPRVSRYLPTKLLQLEANRYGDANDRTVLNIRNSHTQAIESTINCDDTNYPDFVDPLPYLDEVDDTLYVTVGREIYNGDWYAYEMQGFNPDGELIKRFDNGFNGEGSPKNVGTMIGYSNTVHYIEPIDSLEYQRIGGGSNTILRQNGAEFTPVYDAPSTRYTEISNIFPTVTYSKAIGFNPYEVSETNEVDSFITGSISEGIKINDLRVFSMFDSASFTVDTGTVVDGNNYAIIAGVDQSSDSKIYFANTNLTDTAYGVIATVSGTAKHIETNNTTLTPYIFYNTHDDGSNRFFQRNPGESIFTEYTTGLTNSEITIIKVDDVI